METFLLKKKMVVNIDVHICNQAAGNIYVSIGITELIKYSIVYFETFYLVLISNLWGSLGGSVV